MFDEPPSTLTWVLIYLAAAIVILLSPGPF
jgi:hypothetical protein